MPIYAYKCESCGHAKDVLQKMSDAALVDCPECGKPTFKKQLTAAGFQLKGSGWYVTDFRGGAPSGEPGNKDAGTDKQPKSGDSATPASVPSPSAAPGNSNSGVTSTSTSTSTSAAAATKPAPAPATASTSASPSGKPSVKGNP